MSITGETITDAQIRKLLDDPTSHRTVRVQCKLALDDGVTHLRASRIRDARSHVADLYNKKIEAVRSSLASRIELCRNDCPGWEVTESNADHGLGSRRLVIVRCDECCIELNVIELFDDDVDYLPEAQAELARRLKETP